MHHKHDLARQSRCAAPAPELTDARLDRLSEIFAAASRGYFTHPESVDFVVEHIGPALAELRARRAADARLGAAVMPLRRAG